MDVANGSEILTEKKLQLLLNAGQIAKRLNVKQPNVHKWLARHGIKAVAEAPHPIGKLYPAAEIDAEHAKWLADEANREADERRRETAVAKV